jgi:hypothetical protein
MFTTTVSYQYRSGADEKLSSVHCQASDGCLGSPCNRRDFLAAAMHLCACMAAFHVPPRPPRSPAATSSSRDRDSPQIGPKLVPPRQAGVVTVGWELRTMTMAPQRCCIAGVAGEVLIVVRDGIVIRGLSPLSCRSDVRAGLMLSPSHR